MGDSESILQDLAELLVRTMQGQIQLAGHVMTGALKSSVSSEIIETGVKATINILLNDYGLALDGGVTPENIPFDFIPPYRGGKSEYIKGLARFAKLKLGKNDPKEALAVAFAIANKQKEVGSPISGPSEFIQKTVDATEQEIQQAVEEYSALVFGVLIDDFLTTIAA